MDDQLLSKSVAVEAKQCLQQAASFTKELVRSDGHWCGEVKSNVSNTAEYIMLRHALGLEIPSPETWISWILSEQNPDGSWGLAPDLGGYVSFGVEAYFALKLLGLSPEHPEMTKARNSILAAGGVARVRIFTRFFLAIFGLVPWKAVPEMPPDLILVPPSAPFSIYNMASWARLTVVPLLLVSHHRPIFALPNGRSEVNTFLDELWCDPKDKQAPYSPSLWKPWKADLTSLGFTVIDNILHAVNGLRNFPWRIYARQRCLDFVLEHQDEDGTWAGCYPQMHASLIALIVEGYSIDSRPVQRGLHGLESFIWSDQNGKRMQASISPVWDTILMTIGLLDAGLPTENKYIRRSTSWVRKRQALGLQGDWKVLNPKLRSGGFTFQYHNAWAPDVDDTAAAVLAFMKQNPLSVDSEPVLRSIEWILGMQNTDGGWGAFDRGNDKLFFNRIPFSDMEAMCDPSTADVTARVIEAFGLVMKTDSREKSLVPRDMKVAMMSAADRAMKYLVSEQDAGGAWFGRWGANYIYGTSNVICGFAEMKFIQSSTDVRIGDCMEKGVDWLLSFQNSDGGWGESLDTYRDPSAAGQGPSTASQSAWALMALLTSLHPTHRAIFRGVQYLVSTQTAVSKNGASWPERPYTGVGFPNHFYLGYSLYSHYFPMMALGRYISKIGHAGIWQLD
ncbi:terpene cyclase/mutase family protein [Aspergillus affinis]|uniref:terpene cyclase/mutase family protein n=1 Tax=Aspergillus affinis TaxID=1070780 RepID=UPI0022FE3D00|nr:uncharacterized protein KD926_005819 [Aspergillus affinis]KAI9045876.1 hypothetical protein KD926_005819 [Aspergillus affinis]